MATLRNMSISGVFWYVLEIFLAMIFLVMLIFLEFVFLMLSVVLSSMCNRGFIMLMVGYLEADSMSVICLKGCRRFISFSMVVYSVVFSMRWWLLLFFISTAAITNCWFFSFCSMVRVLFY